MPLHKTLLGPRLGPFSLLVYLKRKFVIFGNLYFSKGCENLKSIIFGFKIVNSKEKLKTIDSRIQTEKKVNGIRIQFFNFSRREERESVLLHRSNERTTNFNLFLFKERRKYFVL